MGRRSRKDDRVKYQGNTQVENFGRLGKFGGISCHDPHGNTVGHTFNRLKIS